MENVRCMMVKTCDSPKDCEACGFNAFENARRREMLARRGLTQGAGGRWRLVLRKEETKKEGQR